MVEYWPLASQVGESVPAVEAVERMRETGQCNLVRHGQVMHGSNKGTGEVLDV